MARVMKLAGLALCVLVVCTAMAAPAAANRKMSRGVVSFAIRALCVPTTESLLIEHEGRHECAYNLTNGDRAVGVGYNLDDDKDTRRSEMSALFADYDKVCVTSDLLMHVEWLTLFCCYDGFSVTDCGEWCRCTKVRRA